MTTIPAAPPRETFAEGLMRAFEALRVLAGLADEVGEHAEVSTRITVHVPGEAQVDGAAAAMEVTPERCCGHYRAATTEGTVTVLVDFAGDFAALAGAADIDAVRCMAAGQVCGPA